MTEQVQELNVDAFRDREEWNVEGDWFPYEVFVDEFILVVDDDGRISFDRGATPGTPIASISLGQVGRERPL